MPAQRLSTSRSAVAALDDHPLDEHPRGGRGGDRRLVLAPGVAVDGEAGVGAELAAEVGGRERGDGAEAVEPEGAEPGEDGGVDGEETGGERRQEGRLLPGRTRRTCRGALTRAAIQAVKREPATPTAGAVPSPRVSARAAAAAQADSPGCWAWRPPRSA